MPASERPYRYGSPPHSDGENGPESVGSWKAMGSRLSLLDFDSSANTFVRRDA